MTQTILILGGSGRFGRHATQAFNAAGWQVRQFDRKSDSLDAAMKGVDVVLNAWSPPGYHQWDDALVQRHGDVARIAAQSGATVILPGNVYVFGPDAPGPWREDTPHLAQNPLARIRQQIETAYRESAGQAIILRCGDFIDHEKTGNWFESYITPGVPKGVLRYPGDPAVDHAWAYLPDAARAAVALAEKRATLGRFENVPFPGYTLTGHELAAAIAQATGHAIAVKPFGWPMMQLVRPFMPVLKGVFEMRYLWSLPHRLDGTRFAELVPDFEPTPLDEALRQALTHQTAPGRAAA
ncbi:MAG TPA: epimerase [Rhodobacterales bacterium]|nr:epimerase [Rhodobacterales bacterium]